MALCHVGVLPPVGRKTLTWLGPTSRDPDAGQTLADSADGRSATRLPKAATYWKDPLLTRP